MLPAEREQNGIGSSGDRHGFGVAGLVVAGDRVAAGPHHLGVGQPLGEFLQQVADAGLLAVQEFLEGRIVVGLDAGARYGPFDPALLTAGQTGHRGVSGKRAFSHREVGVTAEEEAGGGGVAADHG